MSTIPFRNKKSAAAPAERARQGNPAPIAAMIEIADRCNEVCVHCYQVQGQKGEMTTEQVKQVIDDLADMGVLFLTLSGGEPTLRHDFLELVAHARARRFAVKIFTNGLTMTQSLASKLAKLAVQEIQMSLYSHQPEVHDWVTRVPGSFQKTVAGARYLIEAGVSVVLKSPLMSFNVQEYAQYTAFVSELGANYSMDPVLNGREDGDRDPESLRISREQYLAVKRDPLLSGPKKQVAAPLTRRPCGACSGSVHVEANGEVRPCTQLPVDVGNAVRQGVQQAWEKGEEAGFIRSLTWGHLHGCRECDLRPWCHRCFANSQREGGDALGPYPSACQQALLSYEAATGQPPSIAANPAIRPGVEVGPYRQVGEGQFEVVEDVVTEQDRRLRAEHAWIQPKHGASPEPESKATPGALVQLRRPGRRQGRQERIPGAAAS